MDLLLWAIVWVGMLVLSPVLWVSQKFGFDYMNRRNAPFVLLTVLVAGSLALMALAYGLWAYVEGLR